MSMITTLTRMWLTRTRKPFTFTKEYDNSLPYGACENMGLYVHIPFCKGICNFCPYCKVQYAPALCDQYIDALLDEIRLVCGGQAERKTVTSLYFGGGTPALAVHRIKEIIDLLNRYFIITEGIGLELHPDNVDPETLQLLKEAGVTKISIGIQSFSQKYQKILGRKALEPEKLRTALEAVTFETVSMDFIFALPDQTYDDLRDDIDAAFSIGANHVAIYPFIDFTFTKSPVKAMGKKEKRALLDAITHYCLGKGYTRSSIWTFSSEPEANYSSMTRETFLGFGCSATSLLRDQFKINTFDITAYCDRIRSGQLPTSLTTRFTPGQRMVYWLFWTAYSTHVPSEAFEAFFGIPLKKSYGFEFWLGKKLGFFTEEEGIYTLTTKGAFYYHYYENFYTLSYIDKMWGIMRTEAFPTQLKL